MNYIICECVSCVVSAGEAHICERKTDYAFEVSAQHACIYYLCIVEYSFTTYRIVFFNTVLNNLHLFIVKYFSLNECLSGK